MKDKTNGNLNEQLRYADEIGDTTLRRIIEHMNRIDENGGSETVIENDPAPRSFYFQRLYRDKNFKSDGGIFFRNVHWEVHT